MLLPNLFDELFRADAILLGTQHDRGAVRVVGAKIVAFMAAHFLKADPDVGLNIFNEMADVDRAVGIGQGAGDEDAAGGLAHSGTGNHSRSERPLS